MCPDNKEPVAATVVIFRLFAAIRVGLCTVCVGHGAAVQWPPKRHGSERSRLLTTSFVVALSLEHMAFHVFVRAGCSDPCLVCSRIYRINYTATRTEYLSVLSKSSIRNTCIM